VEPVQNPQPQVAPERGVRWSGPRRAISLITSETSHLNLAKPDAGQLHLQRRAPENLRHHVQRAAARLAALIAVDIFVFAGLRALVRAVRDHAWLGVSLGAALKTAVPGGMLNGWQYAAALFLSLVLLGNYGRGDQRRDPRRLFAACALATALPLWSTLWTGGVGSVLVQYATTLVLVWLALVAERLTIDRIAARVYHAEENAVDTLFVGHAAECISAGSSPAFAAGTDYRPIGFVDVATPHAPGALGSVGELPVLLAASGARVVVVCGYLTDAQFQQVVDTALAGGCQVLSVPRSVEIAGVHPTMVWRRGQPLVELTAPSLKGWQLAVKRALDLVGATAGLIVLSPVFALLAVMVKLGSGGPILFRQERVGFGGQPFRMLKFRTMVNGADAAKSSVAHLNHSGDPRLFKIPNDPRVTAMGRWFRRWSLDELPQLWSVLIGDMSLVGPRPFFPSDLPLYQAHHFSRLGAKPGVTGLWQVSGRSDIVDFEEVVRLDTQYIREWSLLLDFEILLRTIPAVFRRNGAL
jgi:exopolysaccharide biosynthesis polyprenyl glycosylphosphotransferase